MTQSIAVFDLRLRSPTSRTMLRRGTSTAPDQGAIHGRQIAKPRRTRELSTSIASPAEARRLFTLWQLTINGVLPMDYEDPEEGLRQVVFADRVLRVRYESSRHASFTVPLLEWLD